MKDQDGQNINIKNAGLFAAWSMFTCFIAGCIFCQRNKLVLMALFIDFMILIFKIKIYMLSLECYGLQEF